MTSPALTWTSRFAGRPRLLGGALGIMVLLILWAVVAGSSIDRTQASSDDEHTDIVLYRAIVDRMDGGMGYYKAVSIEQPARAYPTEPVVSVREPTLAWFITTAGRPAAVATLLGLAIVALGLTLRTFDLTERSRRSWIAATLLAASGIGTLCRPSVVEQHEVWVALLVYVGLIARGHGWVLTAVGLMLVASLVRELVAPVMALMLLLALVERRRREAWVWAASLAVFAGLYAWHAWQVGQMTGPTGPSSPGWLELGGWPFVVDAFWGSTPLTVLPHAVAAVLVPLALLGWLSRAGELFDRVSLVLLAYVALFCVAGRLDNFYWGMLVGVLLMPGIAFGVAMLASTVRRTSTRPSSAHAPA